MKKKVVAVCATVALAAVAFGGATLAYFTDQDQVKNNFTIGDISIDLWETAGVKDADGNVLQGTVDKETGELIPTVATGKGVKDQGGFDYTNLMPSYQIVKQPVIENTSETNGAYVRVVVTVNNSEARNAALDVAYESQGKSQQAVQAIYDKVFKGWGINNTAKKDGISGYENEIRNAMRQRAEYSTDQPGVQVFNIDSVRCPYVGAGYQWNSWNAFQKELEKSNTTFNCPMGSDTYYKDALAEDSNVYVFYLKLDAGASYTLFDGLSIPEDFTADQMKMFDGLDINVYADAIQAAGFNNTVDGEGASAVVTEYAWQKAFTALEEAHPLGWWK